MVDYRKFLGKAEPVVAPWWGGRQLELADRRLRLATTPPQPGWYQFEVKGRVAHPLGPADAPSLDALPRVRGFVWRDRLVTDGGRAEPLRLLPADEPPRFAPATARRWPGGGLIFEGLEFESEVEGQVREALAAGTGLGALKNVPAPLRAAFALALVEQAARKQGVPVAASEVRGHLLRVAEEGAAGAETFLRALIAEREESEREMRELRARIAAAQVREDLAQARAERARRPQDADDRVWAALEKAGAAMESCRRLQGGQLEVVFAYAGERFISVVNEHTLQVLDSGICLGHPPSDELVTLESLPGVIQEAIDTNRLVILREP